MKPQLPLEFTERNAAAVASTIASTKLLPFIELAHERFFRCYSRAANKEFYLSLAEVNAILSDENLHNVCISDQDGFLPTFARSSPITDLSFMVRSYDAKHVKYEYEKRAILECINHAELEVFNDFMKKHVYSTELPIRVTAGAIVIQDPTQLATIAAESLVETIFANEFNESFTQLFVKCAAIMNEYRGLHAYGSELFADQEIRLLLYKRELQSMVLDYTKWRYIVLPDIFRAAYQIQCLIDTPELLVLTSLPKFDTSAVLQHTNTDILQDMMTTWKKVTDPRILLAQQLWGLLYSYTRIASIDDTCPRQLSRQSDFIDKAAYEVAPQRNALGIPLSERLIVVGDGGDIIRANVTALLNSCTQRFAVSRMRHRAYSRFETPFEYESIVGVAWFCDRIEAMLQDPQLFVSYKGNFITRAKRQLRLGDDDDDDDGDEETTFDEEYRKGLFSPKCASKAALMVAMFLIDTDEDAKHIIAFGQRFSRNELCILLQKRLGQRNFTVSPQNNNKNRTLKQWLQGMTDIKEKRLMRSIL